MDGRERRRPDAADRRRWPRGGRRAGDRPGRHPRVLVAESYRPALEPCLRYLELFNFDVRPADDAATLGREISTGPLAIALVGTSLCNAVQDERVRRTWQAGEIPLVLMADTVADAEAFLEGDVRPAAVLVRPFTLAAMLEAIRSVLRSRTPTVVS